MSKGVTVYDLNYVFRNDVTDREISETILKYLQLYDFKEMRDQYGKVYYQAGDGLITAIKGFAYFFTDSKVVINVWMNKKGKERKLEGMYGAVWITEYKDELSKIVNSVKEIINANAFVMTTRGGMNMMNTEVNENTVNQTFNSSNNSQKTGIPGNEFSTDYKTTLNNQEVHHDMNSNNTFTNQQEQAGNGPAAQNAQTGATGFQQPVANDPNTYNTQISQGYNQNMNNPNSQPYSSPSSYNSQYTQYSQPNQPSQFYNGETQNVDTQISGDTIPQGYSTTNGNTQQRNAGSYQQSPGYVNNGANQYQGYNQYNSSIPQESFEDMEKRKEKQLNDFALAGFIISIAMVVLLCIGVRVGIIGIALSFWFSIEGKKSTKNAKLAKAGFIISCVYIGLFILSIIIGILV